MDDLPIAKSLDKGLRILEIIGESESSVTIFALSKILSVNKSTFFRLLSTLRSRGFVINPPNSKAFVLGSAIVALAEQTEWINTLVQIADEHLEELTSLTGETTHLAIFEGNQTLIIANELSPQSIGVTIGKGATGSLHSTSFGKALTLDSDKGALVKLLGSNRLKAFTPNTIVDLDLLHAHNWWHIEKLAM